MKSILSQKMRVLEILNSGKTLTGLEALYSCGTMKLSTRVGELKRAGHPIKSRWVVRNDKNVKEYYIDEKDRKVS